MHTLGAGCQFAGASVTEYLRLMHHVNKGQLHPAVSFSAVSSAGSACTVTSCNSILTWLTGKLQPLFSATVCCGSQQQDDGDAQNGSPTGDQNAPSKFGASVLDAAHSSRFPRECIRFQRSVTHLLQKPYLSYTRISHKTLFVQWQTSR